MQEVEVIALRTVLNVLHAFLDTKLLLLLESAAADDEASPQRQEEEDRGLEHADTTDYECAADDTGAEAEDAGNANGYGNGNNVASDCAGNEEDS